jgi:hypothetical protein
MTKNPTKSYSTYLVRTPYSYCFRLAVPSDLQTFIGKKELRYSLKTGYLSAAKRKARYLAGVYQEYFVLIRELLKMGDITEEEIRELINASFRDQLKHFENLRIYMSPTDIESYREAIQKGLPTVTQFISEFLKDYEKVGEEQLNLGHMIVSANNLDNILSDNNIEMDKDSFLYKKMCREYAIIRKKYIEIERKRSKGDYSDDIEEIFPTEQEAVPKTPTQTENSINLNHLRVQSCWRWH